MSVLNTNLFVYNFDKGEANGVYHKKEDSEGEGKRLNVRISSMVL